MKGMREVTGIWIRKSCKPNSGEEAEVLIEFGGSWHLVRVLSTRIFVDGNSSEIIEMRSSNFMHDYISDRENPPKDSK